MSQRLDQMMVRDKSGDIYTFFREWSIRSGAMLRFAVDRRKGDPKEGFVKRFTSPRGVFMYLRGLLGRGDFRFLDQTGRKWRVDATPETFARFLAWLTGPNPPVDVRANLPTNFIRALERVESRDGEYDLLLPTRVAPVEGQAELGTENVALLALSADNVVLLTEGDRVSPILTRARLSLVSIKPISELPWRRVSSDTRAYNSGIKRGTRGHNTVCTLSMGLGREVFLQMAVEDIEAARARLGQAA